MHSFAKNNRGSITLVALCLATVIGISLASYIALCQQSLLLSNRTVQLSRTRLLAETGLEEALWALNNNNWTTGAWDPPTDEDGDGTSDDRRKLFPYAALGEGASGEVLVAVLNYASDTPAIKATATVTVSGSAFTRTLTSTTKPAPLFVNALGIVKPSAAVPLGNTYAVIFNNDGLVDSWDSDYLGYAPLGPIPVTTPSTPNRDYNGTTAYPGTVPATFTSPPSPYFSASPTSTYPDLSFNYAAVIAAPNIVLNNTELRGYAVTFGNTISTNSNSKILAPPPPGTSPVPPNIATTRVGKSAFVPSFTVATPTPSSTGNLNSIYTTSDTISIGGIQYVTSLEVDGTLGGALGITVDITKPTVIIVQGDLYLHHGGKIRVFPPDGRLEIFVAGDIKIGGITTSTAGFVNDTDTIPIERNEPKRLALYSISTSSSRIFQYYTTLPFSGVIYSAAPNAKIEFLATNPKIYGAVLANYNIEFAAGTTPEIHYDTALQYLRKGWFKGVTTPFIIDQVTETVLP